MFYEAGLNICRTCPVRAWCLRQVDPARYTAYEGVTGGYVWKHGLPELPDPLDHTLTAYLATRPNRKPPRPVGRPRKDTT